jgi:hypothetical protein
MARAHKSDEEAHFAALGLFVSSYAMAEASVHILARYLSGLKDDAARAIFGGMRISDLAERIRRLMEINDIAAPIRTDINDCLTQLDKLSDARNRLVHRMTLVHAPLILRTNNFLTVKAIERTEVNLFTRNILIDMRTDCLSIFIRLRHIAEPDLPYDDDIDRAVRRPWLYKDAPPNIARKPPRKAPPEDPPLPASFPP